MELHTGAITEVVMTVDWSARNLYEDGAVHEWIVVGADGLGDVPILTEGFAPVGAMLFGRFVDLDDLVDTIQGDDSTGAEVAAATAVHELMEEVRDSGAESYGAEGPVMNFFYPVPGARAEELARRIANCSSVCVVSAGEFGVGFALTGGGMDLGWEVGSAYVAGGYYPPSWLDLPCYSGRGISADDKAVAGALIESKRIHIGWLTRSATRTLEMLAGALER